MQRVDDTRPATGRHSTVAPANDRSTAILPGTSGQVRSYPVTVRRRWRPLNPTPRVGASMGEQFHSRMACVTDGRKHHLHKWPLKTIIC